MNSLSRSLSLAAIATFSTLAWAKGPATTAQVVEHHLAASAAGDVPAVLRDYADTAVTISPNGQTQGKAALEKLFTAVLAGPPGARPRLILKQQVFIGEVGYITWVQNEGKAGETQGSDTFIVHQGKIIAQTVVMFTAPAAGR